MAQRADVGNAYGSLTRFDPAHLRLRTEPRFGHVGDVLARRQPQLTQLAAELPPNDGRTSPSHGHPLRVSEWNKIRDRLLVMLDNEKPAS
jgi:hypothetical protein